VESRRPRRPTPAEYSYTPEEEIPTQPGVPDDRARTLTRLYANLTPDERRQLVLLADAWFRCSANRRALVGGLAAELAG
jgi:hypothetical protein